MFSRLAVSMISFCANIPRQVGSLLRRYANEVTLEYTRPHIWLLDYFSLHVHRHMLFKSNKERSDLPQAHLSTPFLLCIGQSQLHYYAAQENANITKGPYLRKNLITHINNGPYPRVIKEQYYRLFPHAYVEEMGRRWLAKMVYHSDYQVYTIVFQKDEATLLPHSVYFPWFCWHALARTSVWSSAGASSSSVRASRRSDCCFMVRDSRNPYARIVYKQLSSICSVDLYSEGDFCGDTPRGSVLYSDSEIVERYEGYRFVVCVEDVLSDGNISASLLYAFAAGAVPLYYGAPDIGMYFNKEAFIDLSTPHWRRDFRLLLSDKEAYAQMAQREAFGASHRSVIEADIARLHGFTDDFMDKVKAFHKDMKGLGAK